MVRVTLGGPQLAGLELGLPAGSVRLLLPPPGTTDVVLPSWNGNEFRDADGGRPVIRTLTPLRLDTDALELDVEIVRHGHGPLSAWAGAAGPGAAVAVSGTGRGYEVDATAPQFLLAGDESALPAIATLLPALPAGAHVDVVVEIAAASGRLALPSRPGLSVHWCELDEGARPGDALVPLGHLHPTPLASTRLGGRGGRRHATHPPAPLRRGRPAAVTGGRPWLLEARPRRRPGNGVTLLIGRGTDPGWSAAPHRPPGAPSRRTRPTRRSAPPPA